jgi:hypothetical protein
MEANVSSLGMNQHGIVRSASEFKEIFEDIGESLGPYHCPFCETPYEDRCIVTECVKAPHFKLPKGSSHRHGCNGEVGDFIPKSASSSSKAPERTVEGEIDIPEALVNRRRPTSVRNVNTEGSPTAPDALEVVRRRKLLAADDTLSARYTSSLIRTVVHAYKRLRKHAYETAVTANLRQGTAEYNTHFRKTLHHYPLALYQHKLSYGNAFQGSKLSPWNAPRVYYGSGRVELHESAIVIKDKDVWPRQPMDKVNAVPFEVKLSRSRSVDAPTRHLRAQEELEGLAKAGQFVEWYAYGLPQLHDDGFKMVVESLDHLYWLGQHKR